MSFAEYQKDLLSNTFDEYHIEYMLDRYFHSGIPHIFDGDEKLQGRFTRDIANSISSTFSVKCHPRQVVVCGSAHLGFSAAPGDKLGRPFEKDKSDIDISVVMPELFDQWWFQLSEPVATDRLRNEVSQNLLNGFIDPSTIRGVTEIGESWWDLFGKLTSKQGSELRGRIYRSDWLMQNYHRLSITRGREKLQGARV